MPGDIVSVDGGYISKNTDVNVSQLMVVSTMPMMLGNKPVSSNPKNYEIIAFMGQVPVKVRGNVFVGDYILPSGFNDGSGIAISPDDLKIEQYSKIVGIAWSPSYGKEFSYINLSVGLNANDVARLAVKHQRKIDDLENKVNNLNERLRVLERNKNITRDFEFEKKHIESTNPNNYDWNSHEMFLVELNKLYKENLIKSEKTDLVELLLFDEEFSRRFYNKIISKSSHN